METPGDRFVKSLKQWLKDFTKTKFLMPTVIALSCLVYYGLVLAIGVTCFSTIITALIVFGLLWYAGVKRGRKLLLWGAIATLLFSAILTVFIVTNLQHLHPIVAESVDGRISGTLDPWFVNKDVPFTFHLTANLSDPNMTIDSAHVLVIGIGALSAVDNNYTMTEESYYVDNVTNMHNFTFTTTTSKPVNQFIFKVNVNGTWETVGDKDSLGNLFYIQGPIYKDSLAVTAPALISALEVNFFRIFAPFAIVVAMIWWTRRARTMRQKQIEKWQAEQAKEDAGKPKTTSKVPSLDAAMGKTEEGFVCSECGADVPADATVCPKCGEKFE